MDGLVAGIWSMELFFVSLWIKVEYYITVDGIFIFYEPVKPITSKTRRNNSHLYWKPQQKSQYWMDCYSAWALLEPKLGVSGWQEECLFNPIVVLQLHFSSPMNRRSSPLPIFYIPLQLALFWNFLHRGRSLSTSLHTTSNAGNHWYFYSWPPNHQFEWTKQTIFSHL